MRMLLLIQVIPGLVFQVVSPLSSHCWSLKKVMAPWSVPGKSKGWRLVGTQSVESARQDTWQWLTVSLFTFVLRRRHVTSSVLPGGIPNQEPGGLPSAGRQHRVETRAGDAGGAGARVSSHQWSGSQSFSTPKAFRAVSDRITGRGSSGLGD